MSAKEKEQSLWAPELVRPLNRYQFLPMNFVLCLFSSSFSADRMVFRMGGSFIPPFSFSSVTGVSGHRLAYPSVWWVPKSPCKSRDDMDRLKSPTRSLAPRCPHVSGEVHTALLCSGPDRRFLSRRHRGLPHPGPRGPAGAESPWELISLAGPPSH